MRATVLGLAVVTAGLLSISNIAASSATLRVRLNADIRSVNPGVNRNDATDGVVLHVVEGLVGYSENGTVEPLLAERVVVSDDGLTYTFHLRKGVTFHDGLELTSADVVWNWKRYLDPRTGWLCAAEYNGLNGIKVEDVTIGDRYTVSYRLDRPSSTFLAGIARNQCGQTAIIARSSVTADGVFKTPIGTGPFRFAEWKRGEFVRLTRFDGYKSRAGRPDGYVGSKRPLVDEVRYLVIPDNATAKAALVRGDIDILPNLAYSDVHELRQNPRLAVTTSPTMMLNTILLQTRDRLLANVRLRHAFAAAFDTTRLVAAVTEGLGERNNSVVPTRSAYYSAVQARGNTYNPDRARQLLKEAGYARQPITITANKNERETYDTAVIAQAMLQAVGINARLEVIEWVTQLDRYNKGRYQVMSFSYSARYDPALAYSSVIGSKDHLPNRIWDDATAQGLLNRILIVPGGPQRQGLFDDLHRLFLEQVPLIMLYNGVEAAAVRNRVKGYAASVMSKPRLWEVSVAN